MRCLMILLSLRTPFPTFRRNDLPAVGYLSLRADLAASSPPCPHVDVVSGATVCVMLAALAFLMRKDGGTQRLRGQQHFWCKRVKRAVYVSLNGLHLVGW